MTAYLQLVNRCPLTALGRAVSGFRQREHACPTWAVCGDGIQVSEQALQRFNLIKKEDLPCRPGHILVGKD